MRVSTGGLEKRLSIAPERLQRVLRNALSDTAKDLRAATPGILKRRIDHPSRFTVSPSAARFTRADKRDGDRMRASVFIAEAQSTYLQQIEFGGISKGLHMPVASTARDASGNVRKAFQRSSAVKARLFSQTISMPSAKGVRRVGRYFEGLPAGGRYRSAGLFMRTKDGGIKRISEYVKERRYAPQLGLRKEWIRLGDQMLARHLRAQSARRYGEM
jgi:hypothetical protein